MNKKTIYNNRRAVLDLFDINSINGKQGYVKIWGSDMGHCRYEHEKTKFDICFKLRTEYGFDVWTEAILKSGHRVDILCIDKNGIGTIIEVLETETEAKFSHKENIYPLPIIKVRTSNFDIKKFCF